MSSRSRSWTSISTGNLDTHTGHEILVLLRKLHSEGNTVVIVTHDPRIGEKVDRRLGIADGRIQDDRRVG